ncbi:hypothetical protein [Rubinisphaera italica]|uniref:Uncharacterized protein n=1 Tax=Rubinisphaera italica TaxID=2527969 RepID=A0A5C5XKS2_9PLAN|nr:hypothetical protein [Rubinisphaera italica]TWT63454.1 hypothetical protein Pan54_42070 [Rubinisphaera italica]
MVNKIIWVTSAAIFSLIGMWSTYLCDSEYTILGTVVGLLAGLCVATIALAGEKT